MTLTGTHPEIHRQIIEDCKLGKRKAQFRLYRLYAKAMFNICYRMVNNRADAEDLLQEAFTDAFIKLGSFRYESTFGAWIKSIVVNRCINHLKKRNPDVFITDHLPDRHEEEEINYQDIRFRVDALQKAVGQLPEGYRVILSLYLFEGYDHEEIASILGISVSTSKSQYFRAKLKIREILTHTV